MFHQSFSRSDLSAALVKRSDWYPFPRASERGAWESLPEETLRTLIRAGDSAMEAQWPRLPATLYLDYLRTGSRSNYQRLRSQRRRILVDLVLAYCAEPAEKYLDPIADAVWSICEESSWAVPAHLNHAQKAGEGLPDTAEPVVALFAAETGASLAWCRYLLGAALDGVSPLILPRIEREVQSRVLQPCVERDFWWMKGHNNWNPWINSNRLACALLLEGDGERRLDHVLESMKSIDIFLDAYPVDGGCDEGPNYWGRAAASVFDYLELLHSATRGVVDVFDRPLIAEMGRYIYRVHIAERWFVNFADAPAMCMPDAALVHEYGKRTGDRLMQEFGAYLAAFPVRNRPHRMRGKSRQSIRRGLRSIFSSEDLSHARPRPPLLRDVWLPDTQFMAARSRGGSSEGLFLAAKGGHNAESHNHNDVGQFIVFENGRPLLVDAGVEAYCRQTFSSRRYEIWTMQSCFHNLLAVDGYTQADGSGYRARNVGYVSDDASASLTLDIAPAYPAGAGIRVLRRTVKLKRDGRQCVELSDEWELDREPQSLSLSLLTPSAVGEMRDGVVELESRELSEGRFSACGMLLFDPALLEAVVEEMDIEDRSLARIWGGRLGRIVLHVKSPASMGGYRLSIGSGDGLSQA